MIPRVTQQTVQRSSLANLQTNMAAMAALQAKMSSGRNVSVPSDDPAAAADILRLRAGQATMAQYDRNAQDATGWLTTVDTALTSSLTSLRRARDLAVQGGDGALGRQSLDALATELDGLRQSLLGQANTTYLGRTVFAGTTDAGAAFTATDVTDPVTGVLTPAYTFLGEGTTGVQRRVADATTVQVDADGSTAFGTGSGSVFAALDDIAATLRAGTQPTSAQLDALDSHTETMLTALATVGARQNQVTAAQSSIADSRLVGTQRLSSLEDIDLAKVLLDLQMQEVVYQGALGATSRVLQPSLLDFLS